MSSRSVGIFGPSTQGGDDKNQVLVNSNGEILTASGSGGGAAGNADSKIDKVKSGNYYYSCFLNSDLSTSDTLLYYFSTPDDVSKNFYLDRMVMHSTKEMFVRITEGATLSASPSFFAPTNLNRKSANVSGLQFTQRNAGLLTTDFSSLGSTFYQYNIYTTPGPEIGPSSSEHTQAYKQTDVPILLANNTGYTFLTQSAATGTEFHLELYFYVEDV